MKLGVLIALVITSYILMFASIFFGSRNFKYRTKMRFSFLNVLPCEFNITERFFDNFYGNVLSILSCFVSIAFFTTYPANYEGIILPIFIFGILTSILNILVEVTTLRTIKSHILFACAQGTSNFILYSAFVAYQVMKIYQNNLYLSFIPLGFAVIVLLVIVFVLIKSKLNFNLTREEIDGEYERKSHYWTIILEWVDRFSFEFLKILLIVCMLIA